MNLLARVTLSAHTIFSSPSTAKPLFHLRPVNALPKCEFFSTKAARSSQKFQPLTKPKTQRSSEPSRTFSQRIKKQTEALSTVWAKPAEIPYQAKVANFVNLIGYVEIPVQFEASSDGKHFATTVISLGNEGGRSSLSIPVVFEGDLAHVVACHVKENNRVFVSGQLSVEPIRLAWSESLGKFHVVAENLNFVEGFEKNVVDKKIGRVLISGAEIDKPDKHGVKNIEKVLEKVNDDDVYFNQQWKVVTGNAMTKRIDTESAVPAATLERVNDEQMHEKSNEKSGESASKKKDADQIMDLWRDLVRNPLQWWDYRGHKTNGLVKEKFPDFKQKVTGESLWISSAPKWVLPGLGKLEFDVKDLQPKQVQGGEVHSERKDNGNYVDPWKNLVENPDKWWDNRTKKKNPKAPDFKHKETGEALWLNRSPAWALSKLPAA